METRKFKLLLPLPACPIGTIGVESPNPLPNGDRIVNFNDLDGNFYSFKTSKCETHKGFFEEVTDTDIPMCIISHADESKIFLGNIILCVYHIYLSDKSFKCVDKGDMVRIGAESSIFYDVLYSDIGYMLLCRKIPNPFLGALKNICDGDYAFIYKHRK